MVDFNISIKVGGKALTKLASTADKQLGWWRGPSYRVRMARANAQARLIETQAEMDVGAIKAGLKRVNDVGELVAVQAEILPPLIEASEPEKYVEVAMAAERQRAARRQRNLVTIVSKAAEEASETPDDTVSDRPVDDDWFARWLSGAEDVSDEQMQQLWARILAGEVRQPNTFSLRTVEFLRTLSPSEANSIAKLAPFHISKGSIFCGLGSDAFLEQAKLTFAELIELRDIGIIDGIEGIGSVLLEFNSDEQERFVSVRACPESS
jgi:hypothetical protein